MARKTIPIEIKSISSSNIDAPNSWKPRSLDEVFIALDLEIGVVGEDASNLFHTRIATPEGLRAHAKDFCLAKNRTIVISFFDWQQLLGLLDEIVKDCARDGWEESCSVLQRYFDWEYEDYRS